MDKKPSPLHQWLAVLSLSFGNCIASVDSSMINVALPTIARELHVPLSASVIVVTTYQLVLLMTVLPFAALGEKIGLSRLYKIGLGIFVCTTTVSAISVNLEMLTIARGLQAVGAAAIMSISPALVRSIYPPEKLGAGLALNAFIVTIAVTIAPTLGGGVLALASWRWIFIIVLPLVVVSLALSRKLPDTPTHEKPYDFLAAGMSAVTFLLIIGGAQIGIHGGPPILWGTTVAVGILLGVSFVRRELRSPLPVLPVDLMQRPIIFASVMGGLCVFASSQALLLSFPFRLQNGYGFTPAEAGAVLAAFPLSLTVLVPLSGYLSDRVPTGLLGSIGMGLCFSALTALAFMPTHARTFDFAWRLCLYGAGIGVFLAPNNRMIVASAPRARMAAASGLIATMRMAGQTLGATLTTFLLAVGAGLGRMPMFIVAGLSGIAFCCSLFCLRPAVRKPSFEELEEIAPAATP